MTGVWRVNQVKSVQQPQEHRKPRQAAHPDRTIPDVYVAPERSKTYQNAQSFHFNTYPASSRLVTAWAMMQAPRLLV